jgi:hypothetical protein
MAFLLPLLLLTLVLNTQTQAGGFPPVTHIDAIAVQAQVLESAWHNPAAAWRNPVLIRSSDEAAAYFPEPDLARLSREVDFSKQVVLLFVWHGSGQDRMEPLEQTSSPGAVVFAYTPGLTKDGHIHHRVFILRSDVTWRLQSTRQ